jgi:hypothetical protein
MAPAIGVEWPTRLHIVKFMTYVFSKIDVDLFCFVLFFHPIHGVVSFMVMMVVVEVAAINHLQIFLLERKRGMTLV